jgi:transposase-like protein
MVIVHPLGPMTILTEWAVSMGAFRRNRMDPAKKVVAAGLCNAGYSYREVARMVGGLSYIAARDAYLAMITSLPEEAKKYRREVAIDGANVLVDEHRFWLWIARDVDTGEIMSFHVSPTASAEDASRFLASIGSQCANRPLVRLGVGPNYPRGLLNLDLYFQTTPSPSLMGRIGRLILGSSQQTNSAY